jgi:hypothetical protein
VTATSLIKPDAEIGPEFGDGDIHESKCTLRCLGKCTFVSRGQGWRPGRRGRPERPPAPFRPGPGLIGPPSLVHSDAIGACTRHCAGRGCCRLG